MMAWQRLQAPIALVVLCGAGCGGSSSQSEPLADIAAQPVKSTKAQVSAVAVAAAAVGDPVKGEAVYAMCLACHALDYDRTGPHHCGVVGRPAGSVKGFEYSEAMQSSGLVWDVATLDRFLEAPMDVLPGTKMTFAGVKDATKRRDLIAFLAQAGQDPARCPSE